MIPIRLLKTTKTRTLKNGVVILGGGDFAIVEEVDTFEPAEAYVQEPE
jgi:hypothetical protein